MIYCWIVCGLQKNAQMKRKRHKIWHCQVHFLNSFYSSTYFPQATSKWFCGWFRKFRNYLTTQTQVAKNFSQIRSIYLSDCFIYQFACFCLVYCVVLSTQQDLHRWPCSIMASLRPRNNDTVRGRWVKNLAGPASLLHEWHTLVLPSQSPCTQCL